MSSLRGTAAASRALLPPSPEHTKSEYYYSMMADNTMMGMPPESTHQPQTATTEVSRLHSIARFPKFQPTALACSAPLSISSSNTSSGFPSTNTSNPSLSALDRPSSQKLSLSEVHHQQQYQQSHQQTPSWTSLGALAGSKGVAIFKVAAPQTPLMVLRHTLGPQQRPGDHNSTGAGNSFSSGISSMAFQSTVSSSSLSLAAARGNGILVWDCSGHSISPLVARMGIGGSAHHQQHDTIISLAWYQDDSLDSSHSNNNNNKASPFLLAGATASSAYLWDLRQPAQSSSIANSTVVPSLSKPSIRFGWTGATGGKSHTTSTGNPYVQLACSTQSHDCALLDSLGNVRLFDLRKGGGTAMMEFRAHDSIGIGLSYLPSSSTSDSSFSPRWVTWGLDSALGDPVVRMWEQRPPEESTLTGSFDEPKESTKTTPMILQEFLGCSMLAECEVPDLACARVCAENTVIIVSQDGAADDASQGGNDRRSGESQQHEDIVPRSWKMDLWKPNATGKISHALSFSAGPDASQKIADMLGPEVKLGNLCATEVAISTIPRLIEMSPSAQEDEDYSLVEKREETGVIVLSLTDTGFLTSHVVPEAVSSNFKVFDGGPKSASTELFRPTLQNSQSSNTKIYPESKDSSFGDVAAAWSGQDSSGQHLREHSVDTGDLGQMQFDLDVAAVYSTVADGDKPAFLGSKHQDAITPDGASPSAIKRSVVQVDGLEEEDEGVDTARAAAEIMDKIETRNIPCPRLCGATFGPGVGGLIAFNNGEVGKMWKWYSGGMSMPRRHPAYQSEREQTGASDSSRHETVRTLKDLFDMMKASKESQWGEERDDDLQSTDSGRLNDNFFEDESDDDEDDDSSHSGDTNTDDLIENVEGNRSSSRIFDEDRKSITSSNLDVGGPSADVLNPHLYVREAITATSINDQSPEIAMDWKLGSWLAPGSFGVASLERDRIIQGVQLDTKSLSGQVYNVDHSQNRDQLFRISSDPLLSLRHTNAMPGDDRGVHGGEYAVRPNMQESVDFLKKLYSHQQDGEGSSFGGLMLPPDKRLMQPNRSPSGRYRHISSDPLLSRTADADNNRQKLKPGVYTTLAKSPMSVETQDRLLRARYLCSHNAEVSKQRGMKSKADVWEVLSQIVDGRLGNQTIWNQKTSTALASNFILSTMKFLEASGDVQMLATIVCVLRIHTKDLPSKERARCVFLPKDPENKFDQYIRMYASLLYAWGLLSLRLELNKHILQQAYDSSSEDKEYKCKVAPFQCNVCGETNQAGGALCSTCNDYMFRCTICENAVRGFFTYCQKCGHGGHVNHLMDYFEQSDECPSGCGCKCSLFEKSERPPAHRLISTTPE